MAVLVQRVALPALLTALTLPAHRRALAPIHLCAAIGDEPPPPPALEAALGSDRAAEVWARRPPGALPNENKQAALVDWLQTGPLAADPERFLYQCLRREPKLLLRASSLPALRDVHATLATLLCESASPGRFANALAHEPALLLAQPDALVAAFRALAEATGLDEDALARMLRREPGLLLASREGIAARLAWLEERLQITAGGRLRRVLLRAPLVLLVSQRTMEDRLACLRDGCGVDEADLGRVVVRTPNLLHRPVSSILEKRRWLSEAGIVPSDGPAQQEQMGAFLARHPEYVPARLWPAHHRLSTACARRRVPVSASPS